MFFEKAQKKVLKSINIIIGNKAEPLLCRNKANQFRNPPVFILGAPRSGSTLLFQTLTDAFNVGYLCNSHSTWFSAPAILDKIRQPLRHKKPSEFSSTHGTTSQPYGPSESANWWYRFFDRSPDACQQVELSHIKKKQFRRSLLSLDSQLQSPVLYKNLFSSLRIKEIVATVPSALFVVIKRDLVRNAHSIIEARESVGAGVGSWWSVPVAGTESLKTQPIHIQAAEQIIRLNYQIDDDINKYCDHSRVFQVDYDQFCVDVHGCMSSFKKFAACNGVELTKRYAVPDQFIKSDSIRIATETYEQLHNYATNYHV